MIPNGETSDSKGGAVIITEGGAQHGTGGSIPKSTAVRKCCQCGIPDRSIFQPGGESLHFVTPEIRYLRRGETFQPRMKGYGWHARTFQGQPAMERMICRNCLDANEARDRVWGGLKQAAKNLEHGAAGDSFAQYYRDLCEA